MREYRKNEREVTSEQKIELRETSASKIRKEIELQLAKNKALSLNPAAKVEEKQFETNIEKYDKKSFVCSVFLYVSRFSSGLRWKYRCGQRTVRAGRCGMQPKSKTQALRAAQQGVKAELKL
ncbi:hypothetical protein TNCV_1822781 [Trichonephila clavipes]|nr:hypothetical protein TNCV_1822781 [Trichonephila clavipes]